MLDAAADLGESASVPGNNLEPLKGDRAGQYSIRVNAQYRICFQWNGKEAIGIEIVDYH
jgi:toxin HigB-1